jgi:hypothetical protein
MNREISKDGFALLNLFKKSTVRHKGSRQAEYIPSIHLRRIRLWRIRCLQSAGGGFIIRYSIFSTAGGFISKTNLAASALPARMNPEP